MSHRVRLKGLSEVVWYGALRPNGKYDAGFTRFREENTLPLVHSLYLHANYLTVQRNESDTVCTVGVVKKANARLRDPVPLAAQVTSYDPSLSVFFRVGYMCQNNIAGQTTPRRVVPWSQTRGRSWDHSFSRLRPPNLFADISRSIIW